MAREFRERVFRPETTLIIGGGPSGLAWARKKASIFEAVICIDHDELCPGDPCFLQGDVIALGEVVKPGSVKRIYADFLLNALCQEHGKKRLTPQLKQEAMQQMWRVLQVRGEIIILDRVYNIDWISLNPAEILEINSWDVRMFSEEITQEDLDRSASLNKILYQWHQPINRLGKRRLQKLGDGFVYPPGVRQRDLD